MIKYLRANKLLFTMKTLILLVFVFVLLALPADTSRPSPNAVVNPLKQVWEKGVHDDQDNGLKDSTTDHHQLEKDKQGSITVSEETWECRQMYGFLPCSKSITGHVFLIVVYECLLFHGESYVAWGGDRIFKILGHGVFGASAFQLIGSLPEALILLASGLFSNKEIAQECVLTGVGLLAGSSILLLTILWGTCFILANQDLSTTPSNSASESSSSMSSTNHNRVERFCLSLWPGYGVVTDPDTGRMARLMLVSGIPLMIILFPGFFRLSLSWQQTFILITLVVSLVLLLSYFFYQVFQPWIQDRQLLYRDHAHLVGDILKHMQQHAMERLFNDDGSPNLSVIRRVLEKWDQDGDKNFSPAEIYDFLKDINFTKLYSDKDKLTEDIIKDFDLDHDNRITIDEFVKGIEKWIEKTKKRSGKPHHLFEIVQSIMEKRMEEREMMKNLIPEVLEHLKASVHSSLLTEDGRPDVPAIKRLFERIDGDKDNFISLPELKDLVMEIKFGTVPHDTDAAASKLMQELDTSKDQQIDLKEFVTGLPKLLNTVHINQTPVEEEDSDYQKKWNQTNKLVEEKVVDKSVFAWIKAISLVVLGVFILGLLAEPLIHSVHDLSAAANVPSFFIAFIFVPWATNARIAVSAINEARRKKQDSASLTLSEIYSTVLMNNLLGLSVLLFLVHFRGLSWNFSVEVLIVLIVTLVMGCLASFSTVFPVWTSALAYVMYPLSLLLVIVLGDSNWLSST